MIVAILTDGMENASRDYTNARVAEMIRHQQQTYSWEFIFLAANQDAIATANSLSIQPKDAIAFDATGQGVRMAMAREVRRQASGAARGRVLICVQAPIAPLTGRNWLAQTQAAA